MVERTDAAFAYVEEANVKEAAKRANRKPPSPLLNAGFVVLLWPLAIANWMDGFAVMAVVLFAISLNNAYAAYSGFKRNSQDNPIT